MKRGKGSHDQVKGGTWLEWFESEEEFECV